MKIQDNQVTLTKGTGYWDLSRYPWGGSFHRLTADCSAPVLRIIDTYTTGAPRRIGAKLAEREIGITI